MSKSAYSYEILTDDNIIVVVDEGQRKDLSVTNNIENVLEEIATKCKIMLSRYKVVYRDSFGIWDGYSTRKGEFILLEIHDKKAAIAEIKKITF